MNETGDRDAEFVQRAKNALEHSVADLDPMLAMRLQAARKSALARASERRSLPIWWLPAGAFAVACSMAWLLVLSPSTATLDVAEPMLSDVDVLAAQEDFDFYQDVEFYEWLEHDATKS